MNKTDDKLERSQNNSQPTQSNQAKDYIAPPPNISLPKGGGAIKGIDEKFSVNSVTGTAAFNIPIFTAPSRADFYPKLSITYDSGAGNNCFGLGWNLSIPSVIRKTDKGLPQYRDGENSDIFILSEAEDLVPAFTQTENGWIRETKEQTLNNKTYTIWSYRPRIEGLFARIERWQNQEDVRDTYWQSISKENITSIYGKSSNARIADPQDPSHIFKWLLEESYDERGNWIVYEYKPENQVGINRALPEESNRLASANIFSNCYLKTIKYGNKIARSLNLTPNESDWLFQVVFDYGEHNLSYPQIAAETPWNCRLDPFSSYRAGFEIRTYRLCQRVLMFHCFAELGDSPCLVHSTKFIYQENPVATYLTAIQPTGYIRNGSNYESKSLPPLEFNYTRSQIDETIQIVDRSSLENLPIGLDGSRYQWVDLDSEGIAGILTEQAGAWFYKRNLGGTELTIPTDKTAPPESPSLTEVQFGALELVASKPPGANLQSGQQLMDLVGDGQKYLVQFSKPQSGYYERHHGGWENFQPFLFNPNINWNDPNLKFIDLNGDGRADILISEDEVFIWYPSLAKEGFGASATVRKPEDEDRGAALIFADTLQSIYLADMAGDGLTDIVRIRNGEVCYWPNLGYGRFGAKVTMGNAPWFDFPDQFNQKQIRLADIDGSGTTDIIYLGRDRVSFWFNQSGNGWSQDHQLTNFPAIDDLSAITVIDLLGNGTACLVWSSPLPRDGLQPMRYIDLMGGKKPHLLESVKNNMGMERKLEYAASTRFYLEDQLAGTPWITKLPFPVHVLARVETYDYIAQTKLVNLYRYHHGYYDRKEREFRGFGLVEQWDTESFSKFAGVGLFSQLPQVAGEEFHLPPVYTKTWFHTGAYFDRDHISQSYQQEYYREPGASDSNFQAGLLPDTVLPSGLTAQEEQEAFRALKGRILHQEIYGLDSSSQSPHPYSISERNYEIRLIQPRLENPHAVFYASDRETIDYHYERNPNDPRLTHAMTLETDEFGNVTKTVAIAYPRRQPEFPEQGQTLITYAENQFTNKAQELNWYRIGIPIASSTYEITGLVAAIPYQLDLVRNQLLLAEEIPYEAGKTSGLQKRLIERSRSLYYQKDLAGALPLGEVESPTLPYESYKMAFTANLLLQVYGSQIDINTLITLLNQEGKYVEQDGVWWIPSGRQIFDAAQFYLPIATIDPFGKTYTTVYDSYSLLTVQTADPLVNIVQVKNNYRTLSPEEITDPNGDRATVQFDALGMIIATAVMGKENELDPEKIGDTLADPTTRLEYELFNWMDNGQPNFVHTFAREQHGAANPRWQESYSYSDASGREAMKKIQAEPGKAYQVDGSGNLMEVNTAPNGRWVGTGRKVFDNKGNPIKQYEPYFSTSPDYETDEQLVQWGVTPILHYDPLGRLIRTDLPNGTFTKVEFDPWQQITWDENDTVAESQWYAERTAASFAGAAAEKIAAQQAYAHANTPAIVHLDVLGRAFLSIADNGSAGKYSTRTKLDIEGNSIAITDHRGNQVMVYAIAVQDEQDNPALVNAFDLLGHNLYSHSMDAGDRWVLNNVAGHPIRTWNNRGYQTRLVYDELQRPIELYVQYRDKSEVLAERTIYGETVNNAADLNLRGKVYQHYDSAGVITNQEYDFKGNLLSSQRQLARDYKQIVNDPQTGEDNNQPLNWTVPDPNSLLEPEEIFTSSTKYDALNRPTLLTAPHSNQSLVSPNLIKPTYNEANLLEQVEVAQASQLPVNNQQWQVFVANIDYNAKGQRELIQYGSGVSTSYSYDSLTFRLINLKTVKDNILQNLSYIYDPVGNITQITDASQLEIFYNNALVLPQNNYIYDAIYRLIQATGREHIGQAVDPQKEYKPENKPDYDYNDFAHSQLIHPNDSQAMRNYTQIYEYDPVGNILNLIHQANGSTNWQRRYEYADDSNRLLSTSLPMDNFDNTADANTHLLPQRYFYDDHGSMTQMPHLAVMEWDFKDQLQVIQQQVVAAGMGERTYYVYDAAGQRVRKVTERQNGTRKQERIYLGGFEVYRQYDGSGTTVKLERETLHVMDDKRRIAIAETKTIDTEDAANLFSPLIRYQLDNHLGSASLEVDKDGQVISYEEYYPYGSTSYQGGRSVAEVGLKRYRYTGKERDEESGLYYHGARYYAPWLGRWTAADPIGTKAGINLFSYVRNNSIRFIDPNGTQDSPPDSKKKLGILGMAFLLVTHQTPEEFGKGMVDKAKSVTVDPALTIFGSDGMLDKAAQKAVDRLQGKPDKEYVTKEEHNRQLKAILHIGGILFPGIGEVTLSIPRPPLVTAEVGAVVVPKTSVVVPAVVTQAPGLLMVNAGGSGGGKGSESVPDRIVVGRGKETLKSSIPDPEGMVTKTMGNPSAKADLTSMLQSSPQKFRHFVGKIKEILVERLGITPPGSPNGLTTEGINASHQLLEPGGKLQILQQPNLAINQTMKQLETQIRGMLPPTQWGDITVTVQTTIKEGEKIEEGLLVTAKKL